MIAACPFKHQARLQSFERQDDHDPQRGEDLLELSWLVTSGLQRDLGVLLPKPTHGLRHWEECLAEGGVKNEGQT